MFRIVVVTDLDRLSERTKRFAVETFGELSFQGCAVVNRVPRAAIDLGPEVFKECDAVVTRPTDRLRLHPEYFGQNKKREIHLFTASVGTGHLKAFKGDSRFKIVNSKPPLTNARGVAAFNLLLASALFSEMPVNTENIELRKFDGTPNQTNLRGKTWLVLGTGDQASRLLELGRATGIKKFFLWNDRMDPDRFENCLERLLQLEPGNLRLDAVEMKAELTFASNDGRRRVLIQGISEIEPHCREADVVSLHMPHQEKDDGDHKRNTQFVNSAFIKRLRRRPVLINTARGELLNEDDVYRALENRQLRGVGVDVLSEDIERSSDFSQSPLWSRVCGNGRKQNLIITPHISGSVDNDIFPMWKDLLGQLVSIAQES